jgi:cytoskeleton protein RodZ
MEEVGTGPETAENAEFRFHTIGEQLKAARTERGFTLNEVAAQTRVPIRHLEALETSDFASLPGSTYSLGFAKSYARFVGMDAATVATELRAELTQAGHAGFVPVTPDYEPADPARVPPRWLAWTAGALFVLGVIGYIAWRSYAFSPDMADIGVAEEKAPSAPAKEAASAGMAAAPAASGAVVITATDTVWMKIYDADNKRVFESEMKAGDTFTVPADANNPMIVTGRPQALAVTIGGQAVPPLGEPDRTISDIGVSAAALLARSSQPVTPADGAGQSKQSDTSN